MCNNEILKFHPPGQPQSEDIEIKTALYVTAFLICPECNLFLNHHQKNVGFKCIVMYFALL
jgi:hypothetical protein